MGGRSVYVASLVVLLLLAPAVVSSRRIHRRLGSHHHGHPESTRTKTRDLQHGAVANPSFYWEARRPTLPGHGKPDTVQIAGSSLPDCSHACGSCRPCRLVMVSFVCASLQEAETCPMAYKCMCNNKSYPVP